MQKDDKTVNKKLKEIASELSSRLDNNILSQIISLPEPYNYQFVSMYNKIDDYKVEFCKLIANDNIKKNIDFLYKNKKVNIQLKEVEELLRNRDAKIEKNPVSVVKNICKLLSDNLVKERIASLSSQCNSLFVKMYNKCRESDKIEFCTLIAEDDDILPKVTYLCRRIQNEFTLEEAKRLLEQRQKQIEPKPKLKLLDKEGMSNLDEKTVERINSLVHPINYQFTSSFEQPPSEKHKILVEPDVWNEKHEILVEPDVWNEKHEILVEPDVWNEKHRIDSAAWNVEQPSSDSNERLFKKAPKRNLTEYQDPSLSDSNFPRKKRKITTDIMSFLDLEK